MLFIMQYKEVLTFGSVDDILKWKYWAVLSYGAVHCAADEIFQCWPVTIHLGNKRVLFYGTVYSYIFFLKEESDKICQIMSHDPKNIWL